MDRYECMYACSVLSRNILRHVEVHATLSVHITRGGCRKALILGGRGGGGGALGKKVSKLLVELNRC